MAENTAEISAPLRPMIQPLDSEGRVATVWYSPDQTTQNTFPQQWEIRKDGILRYSAESPSVLQASDHFRTIAMRVNVYDEKGIKQYDFKRIYKYETLKAPNSPNSQTGVFKLFEVSDEIENKLRDFDKLSVIRTFDHNHTQTSRKVTGYKTIASFDTETAYYAEKGSVVDSRREPQTDTERQLLVLANFNPGATHRNLFTVEPEKNPLKPLLPEITIPIVVPNQLLA